MKFSLNEIPRKSFSLVYVENAVYIFINTANITNDLINNDEECFVKAFSHAIQIITHDGIDNK